MERWLKLSITIATLGVSFVGEAANGVVYHAAYQRVSQVKNRYNALLARVSATSSYAESDSLVVGALGAAITQTFSLGEKLNRAAMNDGAITRVEFSEICRDFRTVLMGNQYARSVAEFPPVGVISESEFEPIDADLRQAKNDVGCR